MIIGALITILVTLLLASAQSMFLIPDIENKIKRLGSDKERISSMLGVVKTARLAGKRLAKKQKGYGKQLTLLMNNRGTSKEELTALFNALLEGLRSFQNILIEGRATLVDHLSEEEFRKIIDPDSKATAKREKEIITNQAKKLKKLNNGIDQISMVVQSIIEDPLRQDKVMSAIDDYRQGNFKLAQKFIDWNYRDNALLKDYTSTKVQFYRIAEEANEVRGRIYKAFVELYLQLSASSTDKEWQTASKALKKLI